MARINQEFYCNDCNGYILVQLNTALSHHIVVVCPNCGREHPRTLKNGKIIEQWGQRTNPERILVTKAAYSKTPRHKASRIGMRSGNEIDREPDAKKIGREFLKASWFEKFAHRT